jgi:hypothetical protein
MLFAAVQLKSKRLCGGEVAMPMRLLNVLALVATVVGTIFVIIQFYYPQNGSPPPFRPSDERTLQTPNASVTTNDRVHVEQKSNGNNSPNIVSGGNVVVQVK